MDNITYSLASEKDLPLIRTLLIESELPYSDIDDHLDHFILAKESGKVIACVGLEVYEKHALLRSLAVSVESRSKKIAHTLLHLLEDHAKTKNISHLYLLTTTAVKYFQQRNFLTIERREAPEAIVHTQEFLNLCPSSAICMYKKI